MLTWFANEAKYDRLCLNVHVIMSIYVTNFELSLSLTGLYCRTTEYLLVPLH